MKQKKVEKMLEIIAEATCKSTSSIFLYEPKVPEKLRKSETVKEK